MRLAPGRDERPNEFRSRSESRCPFCAGSEESTPQELDRIEGGAGGWLARSVPNLYPAFEGADGAQEVLIESPRHTTRFADLTSEEATAAVQLWARRIKAASQEQERRFLLLFKNEGPEAGASMAHTHSQLLALSEPPPGLIGHPPASYLEPIIEADGLRITSPQAPRMAYEVVIEPTQDVGYEGLREAAAAARLAGLLQSLVAGIGAVNGSPSYNLMLHTKNQTPEGPPWWIEVLPRSAVAAGLEMATGLWINTVSPKDCVARLRERL